ncbi:efflux transporter outer membrane subunit [Luteolibacter sp. AS25]|uniref:efflux transporter outer membrane subunit n=1 Tax=Luteolibacter sp. AS25 TaxID=3135776 RepID=UPI00398A5B09
MNWSARFIAFPCILLLGCTPPSALENTAPLVSGGIRYQQSSSTYAGNSGPWWNSFSDPTLNKEVTTALSGNLAQQQLASRIRQASASLKKEGAALFPQIDLTAETSLDSISSGDSDDTAALGSLLSWEIDVFGSTRSGIRARSRELDATLQDWLGGRLLLSAAVAETRFLILEQRARLLVLRKQIETNETLLNLVGLRVGQGISSRVDILQQERQLDATKALIPEAEAELGASEYALDILTGNSPGTRKRDSRNTLPSLPGNPGTGVPSDLLRNRPDLLSQWNSILAMDAEVGQALADRLPRFIISASVDAGVIDSLRSVASSLVGEMIAPITDGGSRRAEIELRRAALEEALLAYSSTYIEAIRDVETALLRERKQAERIRLTDRQLTTARETLKETRIQYSQGLSDYLPVIDALTAVQTLELSILSLRREALTLRVALHRALGGPMPRTQP